jgi:hypothetical protein
MNLEGNPMFLPASSGRRAFLRGVAGAACGAALPRLLRGQVHQQVHRPAAAAPVRAAASADGAAATGLPREFLEKGLLAFANAWRTDDPIHGHGGAALMTAYFFSHEQELDAATAAAFRAEVDKFLETGARDFGFEPPAEAPDPEGCKKIVEALATRIDEFRTGGHNVIFSVLPLQAMTHAPELARPSTIAGVLKLLEQFHQRFGPRADHDWNRAHPLPKFSTPDEMVTAAFRAFSTPMSTRPSELIHCVTHVDALATLWELGHEALAIRGSEAMKININREPFEAAEMGAGRPLPATPLEPGYWSHPRLQNRGLGGGHFLKFPFSYYRRRGAVTDAELLGRCDLQARRMISDALG